MTKTTLVVPDIHLPEHDPLALACLMKIARWLMPDEIVQQGDMLEAAPWSRHPRKTMPPEMRTLFRETELEPAGALIRHLKWHVTDRFVWVMGNHEHRVEMWCANHALGPDVYDALSPTAWFSDLCTVIPYQAGPELSHYAIRDDLWAIHGWATGQNVGSKHIRKAADFSVIHGHSHNFYMDRVPKPSAHGMLDIYSMSPGCLRTLAPSWLGSSPQAWSHGCAIIYHGAHSWTPVLVPISNGTARIEGTKITATPDDVAELQEILGYAPANGSKYSEAA